MAKRGDPGVLRFVVLWLRAFARWNQTQLAEACGAYQADVSRWEQGLEAPAEERLRRMAAAVGVPWLVVSLLRRVFALALAIAERFGGTGTAREAGSLDRAVTEPVALAVMPYLMEEEAAHEPLSPEEARREAAEALAELRRLPPSRRHHLLEAAYLDRRRREALAEQAHRASEEAAAHDAASAMELAELARIVARQVDAGARA